MFLDRAFVWLSSQSDPVPSELDTQFKLYYQYIKHAFGLSYLPKHVGGSLVLVRLDNHSSQAHKAQLIEFAEALPAVLKRNDIKVQVTFINSAKSPRLQICDVLMGAAGSHGNKMHIKRQPGQRGMKQKQALRNQLCVYIYEALKNLDRIERGSGAFNWFETTGHNENLDNRYHHALRIWKFKPKDYLVDRGWQNDHLDRYGNYIAPDIA
ncbi:conserved hypothetical protein [Candidatus Terasakiella magnetica]|nr:conserved hypothetical protein [Candidatus Terasakiella magnetica]